MKLMTKQIEELFLKQGYTGDKSADDIKIVCKFFNPAGSGTWYCYEYDPVDKIFQAYVDLFGPDSGCCESGSVSLNELESYRSKYGTTIERDLHFEPFETTLSELIVGARP